MIRAAAPLYGSEAPQLPRIAVLGVGHVGRVIARIAVDAGYDVTIAASGAPERIALIAGALAPGAEPRWAADAVDDADGLSHQALMANVELYGTQVNPRVRELLA
jgi:saccharopine dehydrogenase-like NADP-dependent oxidoreductase